MQPASEHALNHSAHWVELALIILISHFPLITHAHPTSAGRRSHWAVHHTAAARGAHGSWHRRAATWWWHTGDTTTATTTTTS